MKTVSILINTYNYGRFVSDAVASALAQSHAPDEVIVVDDGSTDDTLAVLATKFGQNPLVKVVHQRNSGQLAAFVTGFEHATGDFILMLDADDTYAPEHVAGVVRAFAEQPDVDFLFTAHREFGEGDAIVLHAPSSRSLGFSLIGTYARTRWIGSVTSTLALRRPLVLTMLPVLRLIVPQWRIRADDCLVMGASMAGSQKYYLAGPTVNYRVHDKNHFHRRAAGIAGDYAHWLRREALKTLFARELGIPADVAQQVDTEFTTIPCPTHDDYVEYVAIVWSLRLSIWARLKKRLKLYRHFKRANQPGMRSA